MRWICCVPVGGKYQVGVTIQVWNNGGHDANWSYQPLEGRLNFIGDKGAHPATFELEAMTTYTVGRFTLNDYLPVVVAGLPIASDASEPWVGVIMSVSLSDTADIKSKQSLELQGRCIVSIESPTASFCYRLQHDIEALSPLISTGLNASPPMMRSVVVEKSSAVKNSILLVNTGPVAATVPCKPRLAKALRSILVIPPLSTREFDLSFLFSTAATVAEEPSIKIPESGLHAFLLRRLTTDASIMAMEAL